MEAYKGNESYIFISYARKDSEKVTPFLEALSGAGYRVWWDTGIKAGEHWTETLVKKVEECAVFCPLLSKAFNASDFCFEETDYAFGEKKTIVPIYLEEMQKKELRPLYRLLHVRQNLRLYEYADAAEFVDGLGREQAFTSCKAPEWNKTGQIQWRFSDADGVLTIAKNEDIPEWYFFGSIPPYQHDPVYLCSTAPWMTYRKKILFVEIADDIDAIGDCAFEGCECLTDVHIGDGVTKIGDRAFRACHNLKNASIPDSVTKIGVGAFHGCISLKNVRIPYGVTKISADAFRDCYSLMNALIPDSVTKINIGAFDGCKSLKSVKISARAKVGIAAFSPNTLVIRRAAPGQ